MLRYDLTYRVLLPNFNVDIREIKNQRNFFLFIPENKYFCQMKKNIPATMKAVVITESAEPKVIHIPVPQPGPGEVLVKMYASPINPSDLAFLAGGYGIKKPFPVIPGFEGSGTVIAAGNGILPKIRTPYPSHSDLAVIL